MGIVPISRHEFDRFKPSRGPMSDVMVKEMEWYKDETETIIGLVAQDNTDKELALRDSRS